MEISSRQPRAANVKLACRARRRKLHIGIENIHGGIGYGPADWHGSPDIGEISNGEAHAKGGSFCWAIPIDNAAGADAVPKTPNVSRGDRIATHQELLNRGERKQIGIDNTVEQA